MTQALPSNLRGALTALAAFAIYAVHDALIKSLGANYSAFQIVFFSVLFGFPLTTLMLIRDRTDGNLRPRRPMWTVLRTVFTVIATLSVFYAFSALPLAQTYAILFSMPLIISLVAVPILGERIGWRRGIAILVGLGGVMAVLRPGTTDLTLGHAAALSAAVFLSLISVILRKIGHEERSAVLVLYPMLANFIVMGCILPFVYVPVAPADMAGMAALAALAVVALLVQIQAYKMSRAVIVAPMQYSQIIWATLFGALFFDEVPDLNTAIGAAIIIGSGVYIVLREDGATGSGTPVLKTQSRFGPIPLTRISLLQRFGRKSD
ncbi:EamA/RhaT family transporter [Litorivita pollutaquae]|uniref:EamA/RhaT family transporter n=1 Tax=Litorivita pollutaquae TaxID=2200892 RepID=A0A2V4MLA5_9RHOB|nr:DMT family transporter [Litorivita pollutaquae]OUS19534.1 EamA family transporter [Rhodobacterales bacterium 59_46_T64]PYC47441.1 EamA/RhaT family transporter [Litorivita pollutaquae]